MSRRTNVRILALLLPLGLGGTIAGAQPRDLHFHDQFETDEGWTVFEEIVGGCYGSGIAEVSRSTAEARSGRWSLLVEANAADSPKSNHVLAQKKLNATGLDGRVRYELAAFIDPASARTSQTGPEWSMQNTREIASGVHRTEIAGLQYVANPYLDPTWNLWTEVSPGVAAWKPLLVQPLSPGRWYKFALVVDFDAHRYVRLVVSGPDVEMNLDLSDWPIAQEARFHESAFWLTLEGENLWYDCEEAQTSYSSKIHYDDVKLLQSD